MSVFHIVDKISGQVEEFSHVGLVLLLCDGQTLLIHRKDVPRVFATGRLHRLRIPIYASIDLAELADGYADNQPRKTDE